MFWIYFILDIEFIGQFLKKASSWYAGYDVLYNNNNDRI